jgi:integrase
MHEKAMQGHSGLVLARCIRDVYYTGIRLNALLTLRYRDVDWVNKIITVQADTEKTHREFSIPIMPGLEPHIMRLLESARDNSGAWPKAH